MPVLSAPELRRLLASLGYHLTKKRSQNFLISAGVAATIVDALFPPQIRVPAEVLEIGPGLGALSDALAAKASRLWLLELDRGMAEYLVNHFAGEDRVEVLQGDALAIEWPPAARIISNTPYAITGPLVERMAVQPGVACAVLMVQKELADRMLAPPGTPGYSRLTVTTQAFFTVEKIAAVGPNNFYPVPSVASVVLRLVPRATPELPEQERAGFLEFLAHVFPHKGKMLRNGLKHWLGQEALAPLEPLLAKWGEKRPREISPTIFLQIYQELREARAGA
jgi:16S rRNA (adenine1518-N6/adenine1519-N6)-dimethyltransferase